MLFAGSFFKGDFFPALSRDFIRLWVRGEAPQVDWSYLCLVWNGQRNLLKSVLPFLHDVKTDSIFL